MLNERKNPTQIQSENLFPVVGVGASAGGLDAFKDLIKAIPEDSGMAYILIQHLAPQHESILTAILQKSTVLPVVEITDHIKVEPNFIYVIPSNKILTANDGILILDPWVKGDKVNTIDTFFTSLAEIHQEHAIGIILTGTGNDGTVGLKTIKDQGGITIVQDAETATHYNMPQSAIDAEVVDYILPPEEIPHHLMELVRTAKIAPSNFSVSDEVKEEDSFRQIMALLRAKRGVDFTYYKQTTIRRRILRRKLINKIEKLKDYKNFLLEHKAEQDALYNDLLIPVTAFFRDPKTFSFVYEEVLAFIFKNKAETDTTRIWVVGCSTGEEAYSIAICLQEFFSEKNVFRNVQIFATDISEISIAKARRGIYQKKDIAGISENRIKQFFTKIDGSYQINKVIREMCVFANQNFLKDPPFAKMDFISCRNVLIYLEPYLQKKAFSIFHYALNPMGFLLLGKSETIGQSPDQFNIFNQQQKIFTRKEQGRKYMLVATKSNEASFRRKDDKFTKRSTKIDDFQKAADEALLSKLAAVGVIVDERLNILQFRGSTGAYLEAPPGKATLNVLKMAKEGLSFELRNLLHKARTSGEAVKKEGIILTHDKRMIDLEVIPLQNTIELYFLVLFKESNTNIIKTPGKARQKLTQEGLTSLPVDLLRTEQLEKELIQAREDMRAITEDQEAANEEMQSANEELLSGSEELQSLNEELETSKEEIQSSNEELTILNQELIERNEQLIYSRKYAEAIVTTIHEPLIVLTKDFRIKSANRSFIANFHVADLQTEGKLLFELDNNRWDIPELREKLHKILPEHAQFNNVEVSYTIPGKQARILVLNARQLVNEYGSEQLILLAFQDITERRELERSREEFAMDLERQVTERTRQLKEANLNLEYSNENLRQFASIASHDLQEPLRKIKTFTAIIKERYAPDIPDEGKKFINKVQVAAERMSLLIKEVLAYSKVIHYLKEFVPTDLNLVLQNVLSDLDLLMAEINGTVHVVGDLPVIDAIPLQMNQLFYNLLTNALKFHELSKVPVVTITSRLVVLKEGVEDSESKEQPSHLEIKVSDNGIGFDPQFAEQIFLIFERLHTVDQFEGTGIGLALCKKIAENHHGEIYASSIENEGALFCVILPLKQ